ncbi:MAG: hypothetical protein HPY80_06565 [Bacteroidales bacterium]|nr:hypothetical protein [Bacteroidales bacterium]
MKMRRIALFLLLAATTSVFTACTKDEESTDKAPTIAFKGSAGFISSDATLPAGSTTMVGIMASANANTNSKLVRFKVTRTFNNVPEVVVDSTLANLSTFSIEGQIDVRREAGSERWTFEIVDKDGQSASLSLNITSAPTVNVYTAILMGGQNNVNVGSFWSSSDNKVMKQAETVANQNKVDLLYFYGTLNQATIAAVDDDQAAIAWENLFDSWSVKNATRFKKIGSIDWNQVTEYNDEMIVANAVELNDSRANMLQVGDMVAFETAATSANPGKKGLFKVISIDGSIGADRTITIEVKIQK